MKKSKIFLTLTNQIKLLSIVVLIIGLFIPFAPAITLVSETISKTYGTYYNFIFGGDILSNSINYDTLGISLISLIALIVFFISLIILISSLFIKKNKINLYVSLLTIVLIVTSSIMFLCAHQSIANVLADTLISSHSDAVSNTIFNNTRLEFGVYGISICGFISSSLLAVALIKDNTFKSIK